MARDRTNESAPRISVLMPAHDVAPFVAEAVESILRQTFRNFELIAIDDGSRDGTTELLVDYARLDGRVRLLRRPTPGGIVAALNDGLALARGAVVARVDADDVSLPGRFARQLEHLEADPGCVAVGSQVFMIDEDGDPLGPGQAAPCTHDEIVSAYLAGVGGAVPHCAAMVRTEALRGIGGYRADFDTAEDVDLFLRLSERARLSNLPDTLVLYRQRFGSNCQARRALQLERKARAINEARLRRGLPLDGPALRMVVPTRREEHHRGWARRALSYGHASTARKHALRAIAAAPLSRPAWVMLATVLVGPQALQSVRAILGRGPTP